MGNQEFKFKKATCHGAIQAKILKQSWGSYFPIFIKIIHERITEGTFLSELEFGEITPVFKKLECMNKENYRSLVFFSIFLTYLEEFFTTKLIIL